MAHKGTGKIHIWKRLLAGLLCVSLCICSAAVLRLQEVAGAVGDTVQITYDLNGGTLELEGFQETQTLTQGEDSTDGTFTITMPDTDPIRKGYTFQGWLMNVTTSSGTEVQGSKEELLQAGEQADHLTGSLNQFKYSDFNEVKLIAQWEAVSTFLLITQEEGNPVYDAFQPTSENVRGASLEEQEDGSFVVIQTDESVEAEILLPDVTVDEDYQFLFWEASYHENDNYEERYAEPGGWLKLKNGNCTIYPVCARKCYVTVLFESDKDSDNVKNMPDPSEEMPAEYIFNPEAGDKFDWYLTGYTLPEEEPVREGYFFDNWLIMDTAVMEHIFSPGQEVTAADRVKIHDAFGSGEEAYHKSARFKAQWQKIKSAEFIFKGTENGDEEVTGLPALDAIEQETKEQTEFTVRIPEQEPIREGYTFLGWMYESSNEADNYNGMILQPGADITGTFGEIRGEWNEQQVYVENGTTTVTFTAQWSPTGTFTFSTDEAVAQGIELIVENFTPETAVSGIKDGSLQQDDNRYTVTQPNENTTQYQLTLPDASFSGTDSEGRSWTFTGWRVNETDYSPGDSLELNYGEETTIFAVGEQTRLANVLFEKNAGNDEVSNMPETIENTELYYYQGQNSWLLVCTMPEEVPERFGYKFLGWKYDDRENLYSAGEEITSEEWIVPESDSSGAVTDVTFTAQWEQLPTTVLTFNIDEAPSAVHYTFDPAADIEGATGKQSAENANSWIAVQEEGETGTFRIRLPEAAMDGEYQFAYWRIISANQTFNQNLKAGEWLSVETFGEDLTITPESVPIRYADIAFVQNAGNDPVENMPQDAADVKGTYVLDEDSYQSAQSASDVSTWYLEYTLPEDEPEREGYFFTGWTYEQGGSVHTVNSGDALTGTVYPLEGSENHQTVTFTAQWTKRQTGTFHFSTTDPNAELKLVDFNTADSVVDGACVENEDGTYTVTQTDIQKDSYTVTLPEVSIGAGTSGYDWTFRYWLVAGTPHEPGETVQLSYGDDAELKAEAVQTKYAQVRFDAGADGDASVTEMPEEAGPFVLFFDQDAAKWYLEYTLPENVPQRFGYTFAGWSYNGKTYAPAAAITQADGIDLTAENDTTVAVMFTAQWTKLPTAELRFDLSGTPDVEGYTFDPAADIQKAVGMKDAEDHYLAVPDGDSGESFELRLPEAEVNAEAEWLFTHWTVTTSELTINAKAGDSVTLNFDETVTIAPAGTPVYYAAVAFDANAGSDRVENLPQNTAEMQGTHVLEDTYASKWYLEYTLPEDEPEREGYFFTGWTYEQGGSVHTVNPGDALTGTAYPLEGSETHQTVTFTAQWTERQTGTFHFSTTDPNAELKLVDFDTAGSVTDGACVENEDGTYTVTQTDIQKDSYTVTLPEVSIGAGTSGYDWTFRYWLVDGTPHEPGETVQLSYGEDAELNAEAVQTKYAQVRFDAGADGDASVTEMPEAEEPFVLFFDQDTAKWYLEYTLPENVPQRRDYAFTGWSYGGKTYAAGTALTQTDGIDLSGESGTTAAVTFTAQWTKLPSAELNFDLTSASSQTTFTFDPVNDIRKAAGRQIADHRYLVVLEEGEAESFELRLPEAEANAAEEWRFTHWTVTTSAGTVNQEAGDWITIGFGETVTIAPAGTPVYYAAVSFDANAGSDRVENLPENAAEMQGTHVLEDSYASKWYLEYTLPEQEPVREGYFFTGWTYEQGGSVHTVNPGDALTGTAYPLEGSENHQTVTFTAQWTAIRTAGITYLGNGGTISTGNTVQTAQANREQTMYNISLNAAPVRDGYFFLGWLCSADGRTYGANSYYTGTFDVSEVQFTAQWQEAAQVVVRYDANGGTLTGNSFQALVQNALDDMNAVFRLSDAPSNPNVDFLGWLNGRDGILYQPGDTLTVPYRTGGEAVLELVLQAQWSVETEISSAGTYRLVPGRRYWFGAGNWVSGSEGIVYMGSRSFYVSADAEYTILQR